MQYLASAGAARAEVEVVSSEGLAERKNRLAFAFYATDDNYALAVLVFLHRLRDLGMRSDADVVALHLPVSPVLTAMMREMGIITKLVEPLEQVGDPYYRHSLVKLRIFELTQYDRVLFIDSDSIPLKSLDDLLGLQLPEPIAAPSAYWLEQPWWTSAMLLARPSSSNWGRVVRHMGSRQTAHDQYFDMEVVNNEFAGEIGTLPSSSFCLNSEWEVASRPGYFSDPSEAYSSVSLVHFTALGKPWMYSTDDVRRLRPHAHSAFYDMWDQWHTSRKAVVSKLSERTTGLPHDHAAPS